MFTKHLKNGLKHTKLNTNALNMLDITLKMNENSTNIHENVLNILEFLTTSCCKNTFPYKSKKRSSVWGHNTNSPQTLTIPGQRFTNRMNFLSDMLKRKCCPYKK